MGCNLQGCRQSLTWCCASRYAHPMTGANLPGRISSNGQLAQALMQRRLPLPWDLVMPDLLRSISGETGRRRALSWSPCRNISSSRPSTHLHGYRDSSRRRLPQCSRQQQSMTTNKLRDRRKYPNQGDGGLEQQAAVAHGIMPAHRGSRRSGVSCSSSTTGAADLGRFSGSPMEATKKM